MASAINGLFGAANGADTQAAAKAATSSAPNTEMFLQLLVTQIKNQDPLNPSDSTQFVSQLAQFSQLEQVIAIRQDIETAAAGSASDPAGTGAAGSTPATTQA